MKTTEVEKSLRMQIHNRFDIEVRDSNTGELKQKAQAFNVICSRLWVAMGSYFKYIHYGSGMGVPSSSDTDLFNRYSYAEISGYSSNTDYSKGVASRTGKIVLSESTAVGLALTEVGLSDSRSSGYLCTHAMLEDMNGNQISILKTATDVITIYATVYLHWDPSGYNGVYIGGPIRGYFLGDGLSYGDYYYTYLGVGTNQMTSSVDAGSYSFDPTTKVLSYTARRLPVDNGNISAGFGWLSLLNNRSYSSSYTAISHFIASVQGEYAITSETLGTGDGTTKEWSTKFDFPYNATVYVDGVAQSGGVTVRQAPLRVNCFDYLLRIAPQLYNGKPSVLSGVVNLSIGSYEYFYNPLHALGVYKWTHNHYAWPSAYIAFSDDFMNWSKEYAPEEVVAEEHRNYKYLRMTNRSTNTWSGSTETETGQFPPDVPHTSVVFDTPPAVGSVITIDYTTPFVPKDENHVYDFRLEIQLSEYSG